jgi:S1-C subfamily serine protease
MKFMRIDVGKQMKRVLAALLICTGLCASVSVHSQTLSYNDTVKQMVRFTLVYLTVKGRLPDGTEIPPIEATGFLVSDDGHVVTAKHAVLSATHWEQYTERLVANNKTPLTYIQENFTYRGKLSKNDEQDFALVPIGVSDTSDLAVLKIRTWTETLKQKSWPILPIASLDSNSKTMRVAAWGFPKIADTETSYGGDFVSQISDVNILYDGKELITSANLGLQAGSSGGPVFNRRGQIVGVVYGGRDLQPNSYFTSGNVLAKFLDQLGVLR